MAFLDFFKKAPSAPPPPPFRATIETLTADATGTLKASNGATLKFGASACVGFSPAIGLEVQVGATAPHPLGGERGLNLTLISSDATYRERLAETQAKLLPHVNGPPPQHAQRLTVPTSAAAPLDLKALDTPPPPGHRHVVTVRFENSRDAEVFFRDLTWDGTMLRDVSGRAPLATPSTVTQTYSRSGTRFDSVDEARGQFERRVAGVARNYSSRKVDVRTVAIEPLKKADASNPELEQAFERAANDAQRASAARVYADWLQGQGDVRGELAALWQQGNEAEAKRFVEVNATSLFGRVDAALESELHSLRWSHGFLAGATLCRADMDSPTDLPQLTRSFLESPMGRFVTELRFGLDSWEGENDWSHTALVIAASARGPFVTKLEFDDYDSEDSELSWTPFGDFSEVWAKLPALEWVHLRSGEGGVLGDIVAPKLKTFIRESGGLSADELRSINNAKWPELQRLDVWFGSDGYGAQGTVASIQRVLDAEGLPKLKHLGLINSEFTGELLDAVLRSKVLKQLKVLDLSKGVLVDADAERLLAAAHQLSHLECINLSENLFNESVDRLSERFPNAVITGSRWDGDDDARYCAVGE